MDAETSDVPLFMDLDDDDPLLVEAVSEAKRTLPQFLEAATQRKFPSATFWVKVPLIDRSDTGETALVQTPDTAAQYPDRRLCHLWLSLRSRLEDLFFCAVAEAPEELHVERGAVFIVGSASVEDWMIHHDGVVFGGFSLRVTRIRLSKEGKIKFDEHTGIREFKTLVL